MGFSDIFGLAIWIGLGCWVAWYLAVPPPRRHVWGEFDSADVAEAIRRRRR